MNETGASGDEPDAALPPKPRHRLRAFPEDDRGFRVGQELGRRKCHSAGSTFFWRFFARIIPISIAIISGTIWLTTRCTLSS
jgi:hypothetical protein